MLDEEPADAVDFFLLKFDAEHLTQPVDRQARTHVEAAVLLGFDLWGFAVVLVADVAEQLLDQVFERDEPRDAAVLVDHEGKVVRLALHLTQQLVGALLLGHEHRRFHDACDGRGLCFLWPTQLEAARVAQIHNALDIVGIAGRDDRHAGMPRAQEQFERLTHRLLGIDRHHVDARHHHLTHKRVAELDDRMNVLAVVVFDEFLFDRLIDKGEQLLFIAHAATAERHPTRNALACSRNARKQWRQLLIAHRRRSFTVNAATRSRCRPNISASSSGVAWSKPSRCSMPCVSRMVISVSVSCPAAPA